jgi:acetoin utilization deacetylase AcuC-like enzyme
MALKNPSANCFRKFKGLQLTFQVVYALVKAALNLYDHHMVMAQGPVHHC